MKAARTPRQKIPLARFSGIAFLVASMVSAAGGFVRAADQSPEPAGTKPAQFHGVLYPAIMSAAGETNAIFFDPDRTKFPPASKKDFDADRFLAAVGKKSLERKPMEELQSMTGIVPQMFDGIPGVPKPAEALFVLLLPRDPVVYELQGSNEKQSLKLRTFTPGDVKSLQKLKEMFGDCSEEESWQGYEKVGVKGTMHWWGSVGVAAGDDGSITHVAFRLKPKVAR